MNKQHQSEALVFGRYLLNGIEPVDSAVVLYVQAMERLAIVPSSDEQRLLDRLLLHPMLLPLVDAGLALANPRSVIRRKLFVLSAILETQPAHTAVYLPYEHSPVQHLKAIFSAVFAGLRAAFGFILVKLIA